MKLPRYEINELVKEDSWRLLRIMGEFVEGFDKLSAIEPAVTIYGSARMGSDKPDYKAAQRIAFLLGKDGFNIITGGGPGIMEAANLGAKEAGVRSVGLNITLPEAQLCNPYVTEPIYFNHFYVRKVMLVRYATAFIVMPGGLGTLDELTEVLNLIQTRKIKPFPVVLFNPSYWQGFLGWLKTVTLASSYISNEDLNLLRLSDAPEEVADIVSSWYLRQSIIGQRAIQ